MREKSGLHASFGPTLKDARKAKKVSQQVLAQRLGLHRNTIGKWERGDCLPDTRGLVLETAAQLRLNDRETQILLEASLTAFSSYWLVPYLRNPFFSGRTALLQSIHHHFEHAHNARFDQFYALSGLGGIGKTQLALEYVYRYANEYMAIFWINAETRETFSAGFVAVAALLQLPQMGEKDTEKVVQAVLRWLQTHKTWLLIFDNVEDVTFLNPFVFLVRCGSILLTTRLRTLEGFAHMHAVPAFLPEEGTEFLLSRIASCESTVSVDVFSPIILDMVTCLVECMDGLPLALDQAGGYIERTGCSVAMYLSLFRSHQAQLLNDRSSLLDHPHSVMQTFGLSFERLSRLNPAAAEILQVCAFVAPDAIPETLFTTGSSYLGLQLQLVGCDPYLFNQTMEDLLRWSLLRRQAHLLSLHRLVQLSLLSRLSQQEWALWFKRIISLFDDRFPSQVRQMALWDQCDQLLPHIRACLAREQGDVPVFAALPSLLEKVADYLMVRVQYQEAERLYQRAAVFWAQLYGHDHPRVVAVFNGVGTVFRLQGDFARAECMFLEALCIQERIHTDQTDIAQTLNNLAVLSAQQENFPRASDLYQQILDIYEQAVGRDHLEVARILNNFGDLKREQEEYAEAQIILQRAVSIYVNHAEEGRACLFYPLLNLASLHVSRKSYEEAESFYLQAIDACEQGYGNDHPNTLLPLSGLAHFYAQQQRFVQAEELYQRVLNQWEQTPAFECVALAETLSHFAILRQTRGDKHTALKLARRALSIYENVLGVLHGATIRMRTQCASLSEVAD